MVEPKRQRFRRPAVEPRGDGPDDSAGHSPLRLSVTRGQLGIELYEPQRAGPIEVRHLAMTLPGLKFPVDLSGGIPVFRHRRGALQRVELRSSLSDVRAWLRPRVRNVLGVLERPVDVAFSPSGIRIGLVAEGAALAFDLRWAPDRGDARWVVADARGVGLSGAALGYALRATDAAFKGIASRSGRVLRISSTATELCKAVLPALGARVPACNEVSFTAFEVEGDELVVRLDSGERVARLEPEAIAASRLAELLVDADNALAEGRPDDARAGYLAALELAPRHPVISKLIAEIDLAEQGRHEAALGILSESTLVVQAGAIGGRLLAQQGDFEGAHAALAEAARREPYAPLAALLWVELFELPVDAALRADALDQAVASCPELRSVRWSRFLWRLRRGALDGALADAQSLEVATRGARAKYGLCMSAAREFGGSGFPKEAQAFFERALRYLPDDVAATAGLARSYRDIGALDRAFGLYERAVGLDERRPERDATVHVEFAELLASRGRDLPQAIARLRWVPDGDPSGLRARALEARWRAQLGDVTGASLAFARLREAAELTPGASAEVATWLAEAARFEREVQRDLAAAERHLAAAIRISPRDERMLNAYRRAAAALARRTRVREPGGGKPEE